MTGGNLRQEVFINWLFSIEIAGWHANSWSETMPAERSSKGEKKKLMLDTLIYPPPHLHPSQ